MHVEAVYALPDAQQQVTLELVEGATIADALTLLSNTPISAEWQIGTNAVGVFGRLKSADFVLTGGDRLECYRPLTVDPKTARRLRAQSQQAGTKKN